MRRLVLVSVLVTACSSSEDPLGPLPDSDPLPTTSGSYRAQYRVPTDDPALAAAAVFPVDHVDWDVIGGALTLHYPLPEGLVGGRLDVDFNGSMNAGALRVAIGGAQGTGECVATTTTITCNEVFADLGALPISDAVVEEVAAREYAGPVSHRAAIAAQFATDPIGIVEIDLTSPVVEDNPGGDDDSP